MRSLLLGALLSLAACAGENVAAQPGQPRWLRGQLHVHSDRSGDSRTPPADVVRWYREHGFDFIVFTDHNFVTVERSDRRPETRRGARPGSRPGWASMASILLTGANRGLGRATAELLARRGHRVILGVRDARKGAQARDEIRRSIPEARIDVAEMDLASLASIRSAGEGLRGQHLDVLFHNAGVLSPGPVRRTSADGIEQTLAVNALAPIALTHGLLGALGPGSRIVLVSSRLHFPGSRGAPVHFDFEDPEMARGGYHPERAYKGSKLAVLWVTYELAERLASRSISVNAVCPGFVPATAAENVQGFMRFLLRFVLPIMPFATSKEVAAERFVELATSEALAGTTGKFFADGAPMESSPQSRSATDRERFWAWACARVGIDPDSF